MILNLLLYKNQDKMQLLLQLKQELNNLWLVLNNLKLELNNLRLVHNKLKLVLNKLKEEPLNEIKDLNNLNILKEEIKEDQT